MRPIASFCNALAALAGRGGDVKAGNGGKIIDNRS
jgi:hypothetical protein